MPLMQPYIKPCASTSATCSGSENLQAMASSPPTAGLARAQPLISPWSSPKHTKPAHCDLPACLQFSHMIPAQAVPMHQFVAGL